FCQPLSPNALLHFLIPPPRLLVLLSISRCHTKYFSSCLPHHSCSSSPIIRHLFTTTEPLSDLFPEPHTTLFLLQFPPSYSSFNPYIPPLLLRLQNHPTDHHPMLSSYTVPANTLQSQSPSGCISCIAHSPPVCTFLHSYRHPMILLLLKIRVHHCHFHPFSKIYHHLPFHIPLLKTIPTHHLLITSVPFTYMPIKVCPNHQSFFPRYTIYHFI
ncbi:hypothetical protein HF521_000619, partial [Silurus meridionalis]